MLRNLFYGVLAIFLIAAAVPGFTQQAEPETPPDEAAEKTEEQAAAEKEGRVFKDRIVVTASRQEEESGNTPAPITVFDRETIEKIQPEKMADLFKTVPGVEIAGEGPFRGLPVIRGLSSNRVLILVDGQRLNNARESTTFGGIQPGLVNMSEVEQIEVLRGPASVQYGSDAIGGVINIITRRPDLGAATVTWDGEVAYEYGTAADSQNARVNVSGTGKGFSFQIGGAYQKADDYTAADGASESERFSEYVLGGNTVPNSGMEQTSFDGGFRFLTGDQGVFRVNAEVVRTKDIGFPGYDLETSGIDINFPNFDRDKIGVGWNSGPVWGLTDISLNAYYQKINKEFQQTFDFPGYFYNSFTVSKIDSIGLNVQGIADPGAHSLNFGLDVYRDKLDDEALVETCFGPFCLPPSTEVGVPKSKQTGLGAYVQDRIALSEAFALLVGLRGDTFDFVSEDDPDYPYEPFDSSDSAVSGNVGVVWSVANHVNLNALVARGFRTPNLQERTYSAVVGLGDTLIVPNPDLDSETSLNYEMGVKVRSDRYFGGLNFFYNDLQDFISYEIDDELSPDGLYHGRLANIEKARIQGVELNLETIFADWWTAFLTYAYTKGDNLTTDEPLSFMPPQKVLLGLRYQRARWWAEANARFVDRQTRLPAGDEEAPGFSVYDLRGGFDFDFGLGFLVALGNITDKLYAEPFNNRPEPGRNFRVTARYRF